MFQRDHFFLSCFEFVCFVLCGDNCMHKLGLCFIQATMCAPLLISISPQTSASAESVTQVVYFEKQTAFLV